jgi:hypothetical protein
MFLRTIIWSLFEISEIACLRVPHRTTLTRLNTLPFYYPSRDYRWGLWYQKFRVGRFKPIRQCAHRSVKCLPAITLIRLHFEVLMEVINEPISSVNLRPASARSILGKRTLECGFTIRLADVTAGWDKLPGYIQLRKLFRGIIRSRK